MDNNTITKMIDDYASYCTPVQTENAFYLDAPLYVSTDITLAPKRRVIVNKSGVTYYVGIPTTQEMLGWLKEKLDIVSFAITNWWANDGRTRYGFSYLSLINGEAVPSFMGGMCDTPEKAELEAITSAISLLQRMAFCGFATKVLEVSNKEN